MTLCTANFQVCTPSKFMADEAVTVRVTKLDYHITQRRGFTSDEYIFPQYSLLTNFLVGP